MATSVGLEPRSAGIDEAKALPVHDPFGEQLLGTAVASTR